MLLAEVLMLSIEGGLAEIGSVSSLANRLFRLQGFFRWRCFRRLARCAFVMVSSGQAEGQGVLICDGMSVCIVNNEMAREDGSTMEILLLTYLFDGDHR